MTLLENVEQVLKASAELHDLRDRLAALEDERKTIEDKIRERLALIANAAEGPEGHAAASTAALMTATVRTTRAPGITERVLAFINESRSDVGALDIARAWNATDENTIGSIRAALSRLLSDRKIRKIGYGRYTKALAGGEAAA